MKIVTGKYQRNQNRFSKIDDCWKKLIGQTIYGFYQNKIAPALDILLSKLEQISAGADYEFLFGRTTLLVYPVKTSVAMIFIQSFYLDQA